MIGNLDRFTWTQCQQTLAVSAQKQCFLASNVVGLHRSEQGLCDLNPGAKSAIGPGWVRAHFFDALASQTDPGPRLVPIYDHGSPGLNAQGNSLAVGLTFATDQAEAFGHLLGFWGQRVLI